MTDTLTPTAPTTRRPARAALRRLLAVAVTVVVTLAVWTLGRFAGADYVLRDPRGDVAVDAATTAVVTLAVALLGWGVLAALERLTPRAHTIWTVLAVLVAALSMIPIFLVDVTAGTAVALYLVHLAVLVLIPGLIRRPST